MSGMPQRSGKNPRRVAAGRVNGAKRRAWGAADRLRLANQCRQRQPWLAATGPRTADGKRRAAANGRMHLPDPRSVRQVRASLRDVWELIAQMTRARREMQAGTASARTPRPQGKQDSQ
jgi:hypothetical protein